LAGFDRDVKGSITIKGMDEINAKLARLSGKDGKAAIRKGMRASLIPLRTLIKELLPKGDTGLLKRAVKIKAAKGRKGSIRITVGFGDKSFKGGKYYGSFRELGTKKMDGSAAFRTAFDRLGEPTKADAEAKILAALIAVAEAPA